MENQKYLDTTLRPLFHQLTLDLLISKPQHPNLIPFIKNWLSQNESKFNVPAIVPSNSSPAKDPSKSDKKPEKKNSFSDEEEDEEVEMLPPPKKVCLQTFSFFLMKYKNVLRVKTCALF
jgi:hypothetical protein